MKDECILATVHDYPGLVTALRARVNQRQISLQSYEVAEVTGLTQGWLAKILAPTGNRALSLQSLGGVLAVLGVKLLMVEDAEAMRRYGNRIPKRNEAQVRSGAVQVTISRHFLKKIGAIGGKNSRANMSPTQARRLARKGAFARARSLSPEQRSAIARKAVSARWTPKARAMCANGQSDVG